MSAFLTKGANLNFKLVMIGLDSAGKSTILYKMKMSDTQETVPTIGFNLEEFSIKNVNVKVWDLAG